MACHLCITCLWDGQTWRGFTRFGLSNLLDRPGGFEKCNSVETQFPKRRLIRPYPSNADGWPEDNFRVADHSGNDTGSVRVLCRRCGERALHNVSKVWVQGGATSQQVGESNTESTTGRCWPFQLRFPPPHCAVTVDVTRRRLVSCRFCCLPLWAKALLER